MSDAGDLTYGTYLRLDDLLSCQSPRTDQHDELLFVVIHQVYELWFKQILHEAALLQSRLEAGNGPGALATARRIAKILKTVVGQLDILETMTPRQFAGFRPDLGGSSGFQSYQFRYLEAVLGRRDFPSAVVDGELGAHMSRRPVFGSLLRYLSQRGYRIPDDILDRDPRLPWTPDERIESVLTEVYVPTSSATPATSATPVTPATPVTRATPATPVTPATSDATSDAAFEAAEVCEALVDIDEGVQEWRYRHVKMVERIIGSKLGTGGSTGADYLRRTLFRPAFPDLWDIRSRL